MSIVFGVPVGEALDCVREALDCVTTVHPGQLCDADIARMVTEIEGASRRLAGVQLAVIAEGISRGLPFAAGAGTGKGGPGRWVRSMITITPADAAGRANLAQALFEAAATGPSARVLAQLLVPTRDAVLAGTVSAAQARVITTAMAALTPPATPTGLIDPTTLAGAQHLLLDAATGTTHPDGTPATAAVDPHQLAKAGVALTATLDPGAGARLAGDEDAQHRLRDAHLSRQDNGMWRLEALLTPTCGQKLFTVLQAFAAPRPATDGTPDPRTAGMRTHDGTEHLADLILSAHPSDPLAPPTSHGSPVRLVVSVDAATLLTHLSNQHGSTHTTMAQLPGGWPLSPLSALTMACDADLVCVLVGPDGSPLDVGDTIYQFSTKQRTAVINRDQHCTFGTCTAPAQWCDLHHRDPYSKGGPTSTDNAALLCGVHHRYVHAQDLIGTRNRDGTTTWHPPTATHNPHPPPPALTRAINNLAKRWKERNPQPAQPPAPQQPAP